MLASISLSFDFGSLINSSRSLLIYYLRIQVMDIRAIIIPLTMLEMTRMTLLLLVFYK